MNDWQRIGFSESPYDTQAIPASKRGEDLLVGRDTERRALGHLITSSGLHPCIEGPHGVGKTSLVKVVGYELSDRHRHDPAEPAFVVVDPLFQIDPTTTTQEFTYATLRAIASTLLKNQAQLKASDYPVPSMEEILPWLAPPSSHPNQAVAMEATVRGWLERCFPTRQHGAFICILDNLELLRTSSKVRNTLERLRDGMLSLPGVVWVLCGSKGVLTHSVSSTRLEGRLASPMAVLPLETKHIPLLVARRIAAYRTRTNATPPVQADGMEYLYEVLHHNLRNALNFSEKFAVHLLTNGVPITAETQLFELLKGWVAKMARSLVAELDGPLGDTEWDLIDCIANHQGLISTSMARECEFASSRKMWPHLHKLEQSDIIQTVTDDEDRRRKLIHLTPRGWLAVHHRRTLLR